MILSGLKSILFLRCLIEGSGNGENLSTFPTIELKIWGECSHNIPQKVAKLHKGLNGIIEDSQVAQTQSSLHLPPKDRQ